MYLPAQFEETRVEVLHALMRARPLATLVTQAAGNLDANHIPLHLDAAPAPLGTLRGHMARANPLWREFTAPAGVLAIFHGPQTYVSPSWYPAKKETGRVVPTWNYAVVHAHGTLRIVDADPHWLRAQLDALTAHNEAPFPAPWSVGDAPVDYLEAMMAAIVGFEIAITRLSGKFKLSQNHPARNREGLVAGLSATGEADAAEVAKLMREHGSSRS